MKHQFKVKVGLHIQDKRTFKAGETVVSDRPLDRLFPGKFELLSMPVVVPDVAPAVVQPAPVAPVAAQTEPAAPPTQPGATEEGGEPKEKRARRGRRGRTSN